MHDYGETVIAQRQPQAGGFHLRKDRLGFNFSTPRLLIPANPTQIFHGQLVRKTHWKARSVTNLSGWQKRPQARSPVVKV
jgi:hypothetical protein